MTIVAKPLEDTCLDSEPPILWHYTNFECLQAILDSQSLLATDFRSLNDEMEFRTGLTTLRDHLKRKGDSQQILPGATALQIESAIDDVEVRMSGQVICFSAKRDDLSMWRGYSDLAHGGQSVAIGFSTNDLKLLCDAAELGHPKKCLYGLTDLSAINSEMACDPALDEVNDPGIHSVIASAIRDHVRIVKSEHFEVEDEYRIILEGHFTSAFNDPFKRVAGEFRKEFSLRLPGTEVYDGLSNPLAIRKIVVGPKTNHEKVKRYCDIQFRLLGQLDPVDVEQSKIPFV